MTDAAQDIVVTGKKTKRPPDELTLIVGGNEVTGWEEVEVTLRAEGFPNSFGVSVSALSPTTGLATIVQGGDPCTVLLGDDVVVTGFVDRVVEGAAPEAHAITVTGRGRTQDLVDCSAEWPSGMIQGTSSLDVISKIALRYGIAVSQVGSDASDAEMLIPFPINYGESAAELIQHVARNAGLMAYEGSNGHLVLSQSGTAKAASGIIYGQNAQSWSVENSADGRYSDIICTRYSQDPLAEVGGADANFFGAVKDPGVKRHRLLYIALEVALDQAKFTEKKAQWEMARRIGRSCVVHATVDSWRDSAGVLWAPNTLVDVTGPGFLLADKTLCVGEVTFRRSNGGTVADLMLMPPQAFTAEPFSLIQVGLSDVAGPNEQGSASAQ